MSFKLVNDLWTRDVGGTTQRLLFVLCVQANDFGECWPSQKLIAWKLGISKRTVIRIVQKLEAQGVLSIKRRFQSSNRYTIDLTKLPEKPPFEDDGQNVTYGDDISDTAMSPKEVTPDVTTEVTHVSPKPPVNHQDESPSIATTKKRSAKTSLVPQDYRLSEGLKKWGEKKGWSVAVMNGQIEPFVDHHMSKGNRMADWDAAFRTWMRNGEKFGKVAPSTPQRQPTYANSVDPYDAQLLAGLQDEE